RIERECDGARDHRAAFESAVGGAVLRHGKRESSQRDRRRSVENTGEAFRSEQIAQHRERRNDNAADDESNRELAQHEALYLQNRFPRMKTAVKSSVVALLLWT